MYSPPVGGAARRPSATIDKQHTSNRRFIISGEEDYLCGRRNSASGRARSRAARDGRRARVFAASARRPVHILPSWIHFSSHEVIPCLPLPDQRELIAANERFCRQRARIVVRCHHKSVRARAHDREQIAFVQFGHFAVERKKIAGLTHRPDNVDFSLFLLLL